MALAQLVAEMGDGSVADEPRFETGSSAGPLALIDLFNDAETLSSHLLDRVAGQQWLDAFLLAAGLHQWPRTAGTGASGASGGPEECSPR